MLATSSLIKMYNVPCQFLIFPLKIILVAPKFKKILPRPHIKNREKTKQLIAERGGKTNRKDQEMVSQTLLQSASQSQSQSPSLSPSQSPLGAAEAAAPTEDRQQLQVPPKTRDDLLLQLLL